MLVLYHIQEELITTTVPNKALAFQLGRPKDVLGAVDMELAEVACVVLSHGTTACS